MAVAGQPRVRLGGTDPHLSTVFGVIGRRLVDFFNVRGVILAIMCWNEVFCTYGEPNDVFDTYPPHDDCKEAPYTFQRIPGPCVPPIQRSAPVHTLLGVLFDSGQLYARVAADDSVKRT